MPRLIYIETSVPSFYFDTRTAVELHARRNWTRRWWDDPAHDDLRVTSAVVIEELERAPDPKRAQCLSLISALPLLPYTAEVAEIVATYHRHKVMPVEASADADHLALATFHKCDILVTWNCQRPPALPLRAVLSHRLSRSARLPSHHQRQQVSPHPAHQCDARLRHTATHHPAGTARR